MYLDNVRMSLQWRYNRWWRRIKISLACKVDKTILEELIKILGIGIKVNRNSKPLIYSPGIAILLPSIPIYFVSPVVSITSLAKTLIY
jgi:hypothetical protein